MNKPNKHDKVAAQINLIKMAANNPIEFELDQDTDWLGEMLRELNENATEKSPEEYFEETSLYLSGSMEKKTKADMGEFLLVDATIQTDYMTECVRTLKPMMVQLDVPFRVIFLDQELSASELFQGIDETFVDNNIYEIYYYDKRTVDFKEMIHEQIFLNYNQYPVLDAESKLEGTDTSQTLKS